MELATIMGVVTGSGGATAVMSLWLYRTVKRNEQLESEKETLFKQVVAMAAEQKALTERVFRVLGA